MILLEPSHRCEKTLEIVAAQQLSGGAFQKGAATFELLNLNLLEVLPFLWRGASVHSNRLDIAMLHICFSDVVERFQNFMPKGFPG